MLYIAICVVNCSFLEGQILSIRKFVQGDVKIIVFDDSRHIPCMYSYNEIHTDQIHRTCIKYNVEYYRIDPSLHQHRSSVIKQCIQESSDHPVLRCALAVQYAFNHIINYYTIGKMMILDSDMLFIDVFDVDTYLGDHQLAAIPQSRSYAEYYWNGIFICNLETCPSLKMLSWDPTIIPNKDEHGNIINGGVNTDVGGCTYYYNEQYNPTFKRIDVGIITTEDDLYAIRTHISPFIFQILDDMMNIPCPPSPSKNYLSKELIMDRTIIHIRNGGGWSYQTKEYHELCCQIICRHCNLTMETT